MKVINIIQIDSHCTFRGTRTVDGVHQATIQDKDGNELILSVTDDVAAAKLMKVARAVQRLAGGGE